MNQPPPPLPHQPPQPPQAPLPLHPKATIALALGLVSCLGMLVCFVPVFAGPFAWFYGSRARRDIAAAPGRWRGESEAQVGWILGIVATVLAVLSLIAIAAVVGFFVWAEATYPSWFIEPEGMGPGDGPFEDPYFEDPYFDDPAWGR